MLVVERALDIVQRVLHASMDSIFKLRDALARVLSYAPEDEPEGDQELFEELMLQKPRLLSLLDVGQRSPQEQKEVESGEQHTALIMKLVSHLYRENHRQRDTDCRER